MSLSMSKCKIREADLMISTIIMILIIGEKSRGLEVLVNNPVYILCSMNESVDIQWHFNTYFTYVYAGGRFFIPFRGRFQLEYNVSAAAYNLTIPSVQLGDAGRYYCSEEISGYQISVTHLTVLHSDPVCNSAMSSDGFVGSNTCGLQQENMTFNCSVSFNGKAPRIIWKSLNDSQTFNGTTCYYQSNRVNCRLTLKPDPVYHGSVFSCETAERNESLHKCSTDIIKISYFFAEYDATEKKVNENVSCEVTSNLNVKYNWTLKQDNEETYLSSNRVILIQEPGIYQCEVEYSIRNATCSALVSTVNITTEITNIPNKQGINLVTLLLPIVSIVTLGVVISVIFYRKKKRKLNNQRIRGRVVEMYKDFVTAVDPEDVLDHLIQKRIINTEFREALMATETEDRCRALLDHLIDSSNDESFIVLREALKEEEDYDWIVNRIDGRFETGGICNKASVKFLKKLQLPDFLSVTFICGITKLPNRIFILCNRPRYVVVFEDRMPFEFLDTIRIEEIGDPFDIASSRKSECLYIVDIALKTIWEKNTTDDSPLTKWSVELIEPRRLSISNDDRLLVLNGSDPANLVILGLDRKLIQRVSLPDEIQDPLHCIEKPDGGFIISEKSNISELSSDGKDIIRKYESEELNFPSHTSLDYDNDLLFVADLRKNRVIIIDWNSLQLKDIIITELNEPFRLLYDSNKNQLIVAQFNKGVNVYKFNKTTN